VAAPPPPLAPPAGPLTAALRRALDAVAAALDAAEPGLTKLDSRAGDGDLGISMRRGAAALRALPESALADPPTALSAMAEALRRAIGGSSGPFYATALMRAARHLPASPTPADWVKAFDAAVAAIGELGGARAGDRTMLDALLPAATAFSRGIKAGAGLRAAARDAAAAAEAGTEATAGMLPHFGRASYLGARAVGTRDAGAAAVAIWLRALSG
jgi:dihydroxyacetone kinase